MNRVLWVVQVVLALVFLFAGGGKLVMSVEEMNKGASVVLPGLFLRFIGVAEVLGGLAMLLPGLLRIRPGLTPLAAAGLVIIMVGATAITLVGTPLALALIPLVVGILAVFVAYGRWRLAPLHSRDADSMRGPVPTRS